MTSTLLRICVLIAEGRPFHLDRVLPKDRYEVTVLSPSKNLQALLESTYDCFVLVGNVDFPEFLSLPVVWLDPPGLARQQSQHRKQRLICLEGAHFLELPAAIEGALQQVASRQSVPPGEMGAQCPRPLPPKQRNPDRFLRNLCEAERQSYREALKNLYHCIVLEYFKSNPYQLEKTIGEFVSMAFIADVSAAEVLTLHMDLMDEFSKHLKLEGRRDEILSDYRITLIDVISHLCEVYRSNSYNSESSCCRG